MEEQTHVIIKMGFLCTLAVVCILVAAWLVSRWDADAAYRMLEHSQHLFEAEPDPTATAQTHLRVTPVKASVGNSDSRTRSPTGKREYISPIVKKRVAAKQKWRCLVCKQLLDETFEIDHRTPLFRGGHPTQESNLQALCRSCHMFKSAVSDRA